VSRTAHASAGWVTIGANEGMVGERQGHERAFAAGDIIADARTPRAEQR